MLGIIAIICFVNVICLIWAFVSPVLAIVIAAVSVWCLLGSVYDEWKEGR